MVQESSLPRLPRSGNRIALGASQSPGPTGTSPLPAPSCASCTQTTTRDEHRATLASVQHNLQVADLLRGGTTVGRDTPPTFSLSRCPPGIIALYSSPLHRSADTSIFHFVFVVDSGHTVTVTSLVEIFEPNQLPTTTREKLIHKNIVHSRNDTFLRSIFKRN